MPGRTLRDIHPSARKHYSRDRLTDDRLRDAAEAPVYRQPLDDEDDPRRWLLLGFDSAGRLLELVILQFDSGDELIIHAMKARERYHSLLS